MLAILNSFYADNLPIVQPILMILVSKLMVHRALSDKTYLLLGLLSPLSHFNGYIRYPTVTRNHCNCKRANIILRLIKSSFRKP